MSRTRAEIRLECLKMAVALATCKAIGPSKVTETAGRLLEFVDSHEETVRDLRRYDRDEPQIDVGDEKSWSSI